MLRYVFIFGIFITCASAQVKISGIYPHLAMSNREGECGTGAVVPWSDRLWVVTYAPHMPKGSTDKLYEITPDLKQIIRPESIGGTPANRMIHEESQQLFIGPYAIDAKGAVRTIPFTTMYGRPTGNARSLTDPAGKILYATMEEGIYEVDVKSLAVKELWQDEQLKGGRKADLPGYHGKGFYSSQGRYVYANNGDHAAEARSNPTVPSGVLAEWDGKADQWTVVRRNQFTEVTGPGGILGKSDAPDAPLWAIGWDHRSLICMCLHKNQWTAYRLPKGSHSYDGAHGWNTEWPRIRDIGEKDFLMTMHGTFWHFPKDFTPNNSAGISPRSNYLKVVGDFCEWNKQVVLGCDDTAKSEFLSKRKLKGNVAAPRSQSNLWFIDHAQLDQFGSPIGRGAVWLNDAVKKNQLSDPYLFSGYDHRGMFVSHDQKSTVEFLLEVDRKGDGTWTTLEKISAESGKVTFHAFTAEQQGAWIRVTPQADCGKLTVTFTYRNQPRHLQVASSLIAGISTGKDPLATGGLIRGLDDDALTLGMAAMTADGKDSGYYTMSENMKLVPNADAKIYETIKKTTAMPEQSYQVDEASALIVDDKGKRWRFPVSTTSAANAAYAGKSRVVREVATERDLLNLGGTFYELPADNAGGFAMCRPIATHDLMIHDFCSWHGLFLCSGIDAKSASNEHIIRSDDGKAALWVGAIDDLWKFGKPRGKGGPWMKTTVKAGVPSDPYIMTAFDKKTITLDADKDTMILVEVDITGYGDWVNYTTLELKAGKTLSHTFSSDFAAYWVRVSSKNDCQASAQLTYE